MVHTANISIRRVVGGVRPELDPQACISLPLERGGDYDVMKDLNPEPQIQSKRSPSETLSIASLKLLPQTRAPDTSCATRG